MRLLSLAQAKPDYKPAGETYNDLEPGEAVPDFSFSDQSGRTVRLGQWHGKAVLLTFIYTRCPLPNFCVRMSRIFAEMDKALEKDPKLYATDASAERELRSEVDTPQVLRSLWRRVYGELHKGDVRALGFCCADGARICRRCCNFSMWAQPRRKDGTHHAFAFDSGDWAGRKIYKWYSGNEWTPSRCSRMCGSWRVREGMMCRKWSDHYSKR